MECKDGSKFQSSGAYKIFVQELAGHLNAANLSFNCDKVCSTQELKQLSTRFHTIKGGAGFFGLDRIHHLAGELEDSLQALQPSCLKSESKLCAIFQALQSASAELPAPSK